MKKIQVVYWHLTKYSELPYEHGQEFPYSEEQRNEIINTVTDKGIHIMLIPGTEVLIIWIDKSRFRQR